MKKYGKLILFTIISFFITTGVVSAREITLNDIGEIINDKQATQAYIIGEYVFTSEYTSKNKLKTADLMIAAKSINILPSDGELVGSETIYGKMAINLISRDWGDSLSKDDKWTFDGTVLGKEALPEKLNIKYVDYEFIPEVSKATLVDSKTEKTEGYTTKLTQYFTNGYNNNFETYNLDSSDSKNIKISGIVKKSDNNSFGDLFNDIEKTGYYFAMIVKVPEATDETYITVKLPTESSQKVVTVSKTNFDVKDGANDGFIIIASVSTDFIALPASERVIKIEVDLDGEETPTYGLTTYTIDYSGLKIQTESTPQVSKDTPEDGNNKLIEWGYDSSENEIDEITLEGNKAKIKGTLKEQEVNNEVYGIDKIAGYYFPFTFEIPDKILSELNNDTSKFEVSALKDNNVENVDNTDTKTVTNSDGSVTVLVRIDPNGECAKGTKEKCVKYFAIDYDGTDGKEYLKTLFTLDYSEVTLIKSSLVKLSEVEPEKVSGESWKNLKLNEGYSVEYKENGSTFNASGLVTVGEKLDAEAFGSDGIDSKYYLIFKMTKTVDDNTTEENGTVKFLTEEDGVYKISESDFNGKKALYVVKHLDKNSENKTFNITVDYDGGETYAPYTITIDWSKVEFQEETKAKIPTLITEASSANLVGIEEITGETFNYKFNSKDSIDANEDSGVLKLSGSVRKQENIKGFTETFGHFVVLKISGPTAEEVGKENTKKWTVQVRNDDENHDYLTPYNPNTKEYEAGYVLYLLHLNNKDHKTTIKVDWDGLEDKYVAKEIEIDYTGLSLLTPEEVTFTYKKQDGTVEAIKKYGYVGDTETTPASDTIDGYDTAYRDFAGWVSNETDGVIAGGEFEIKKGEAFKANWKIEDEKYVKDQLESLIGKLTISDENIHNVIITVEPSGINENLNGLYDENSVLAKDLAEILKKEEITKVKVSTIDKPDGVELTKSENTANLVSTKLKELFIDETTINAYAVKEGYIKIEISEFDSSVQLTSKDSHAYTLNFVTTTAKAASEEDLKNAIKNENVTDIVIDGEVNNLEEPLSIDRKVSIEGSGKIAVNSDLEAVINVTTGGELTIDGVTLSGAKNGIKIDGGTVSATGVKFESVATEDEQAGVVVENGTINASGLTFNGETYMKPLVKARKTNTTVHVTKEAAIALLTDPNEIKATTVKEIKTAVDSETAYNIKDELKDKENYDYYHYYLDDTIPAKKWIKVTFNGDRGITTFPKSYTKYYDGEKEGETLTAPSDIKYLDSYKTNLTTYKANHWTCGGTRYESNQIPKPKDGGSLTCYAEYTATYNAETVVEVDTIDKLKNAVSTSGEGSDKRYVVVTKPIDLGTEKLKIERELVLTGSKSASDNIGGSITGQIEVAANNVVFSEINIIGKGTGAAVTIKNIGFHSDQSTYSKATEGANGLTSYLYFDLDNPDTTLFHNTFNAGPSTYIDFPNGIDGYKEGDEREVGSNITGNNFTDGGQAVTFINISSIKINGDAEGKQPILDINLSNITSTPHADTNLLKIKTQENAATINIGSIFGINGKTINVYIDNEAINDASNLTFGISNYYKERMVVKYATPVDSEKQVKIVN